MNSACAPATTRPFEINIAEGDGPLLSRVPKRQFEHSSWAHSSCDNCIMRLGLDCWELGHFAI
jgi:hypothetical protein